MLACYRTVLIACAALLLLFSGCLWAEEEATLRVMTFNIRYAALTSPGHEWELRREIIVRIIESWRPDIVALQEDMTEQVRYLAQALPEYGVISGPVSGAPRTVPWGIASCVAFGTAGALALHRSRRAERARRWRIAGAALVCLGILLVSFALWLRYVAQFDGEHNSVLYRCATVEPLRSDFFWLSKVPDKPQSVMTWWTHLPRVVTRCALRLRDTGQTVVVYNVHLSPVSVTLQRRGMGVVLDHVAEENEADLTIVAGDFNTNERGAACRLLEQSGFRSAWSSAEEHLGPEFTSHMFRGEKVRLSRRFGRVDHIFLRPPRPVRRVEIVTYSERGRYPSDHFPVVADVVLLAQSEE